MVVPKVLFSFYMTHERKLTSRIYLLNPPSLPASAKKPVRRDLVKPVRRGPETGVRRALRWWVQSRRIPTRSSYQDPQDFGVADMDTPYNNKLIRGYLADTPGTEGGRE